MATGTGETGPVPRPLDLDAVLAENPGHWEILRRGFLKRCPRCGGGKLYHRWFHMAERCPTCGYRFEREPGFFVGAYTINLVITQGIIVVLLFAFVLWKSGHPEAGVVVPAVIGATIAVVAPLAFYPFSRTIWSAFDLAFTPLDVREIVDAVDALAQPDDGDGSGDVVDGAGDGAAPG